MLRIKILSPQRSLFDGTAEGVILPIPNGKFEILKNHAPLLSELSEGNITIVRSSAREEIYTKGGIIKVKNNQVDILVY